MPLYDFRCPKCGLEFEVSRPFSRATEPAMCPQDGSESKRVFTMPMTFVPGSAQEPGLRCRTLAARPRSLARPRHHTH
jgi:putative FmdB family regulatory protein